VQVGESAGATITLPAEVLRSADIEILGSGAGSVSLNEVLKAIPEFFAFVIKSGLRIGVKQVGLARVGSVWNEDGLGNRVVINC